MSDTSPRLGLPFLLPAQAQKHVTHNEALERLDMVTQLTVVAFDADTPPAAPQPGQIWALGAAPSGAWAGQAGALAAWAGDSWHFIAPQPGWHAAQGTMLRIWDGTIWAAPELGMLATLGVNAAADSTNRLAVGSAASLLTHEGAGHQLKINKAAAGDTASLLFQTGFSGRAEMGTAGNDDWSIKVSPDGSAWTEALVIDKDTGRASGEAVQQSFTDDTAGRLLTAGAFGLGTAGAILYPLSDVDADPASVPNGMYRIDSSLANRPFGLSGVVLVMHYNSGEVAMTYFSRGQASFGATRYYSTGWSDWSRLHPEHGSNPNGEYVRFADGTQICTSPVFSTAADYFGAGTYSSPYSTDSLNWTYPAAFVATPVLHDHSRISLNNNDVCKANIPNPAPTASNSFRIVSLSGATAGDIANARLTAIGRWF